jgi:hypothetical protein
VNADGLWQGNPTKNVSAQGLKQPGSRLLVGNFSYYTRLNDGCWLNFNKAHEVAGYTLAAYGSLNNLGQDVYDRSGEYYPRQRTGTCELANLFGICMPCQTDPAQPNSLTISRGGPDTRPDGVVIVLDSGVDKKTMNVGEETTGT